MRTDAITTDSGLRFQIFEAYRFAKVLAATENAVGTSGWGGQRLEFKTPGDSRMLLMRVGRPTSDKFDKKIRGTVWVDKVRLMAED
ncbi:MAG TPA: hypothetical protein VJN92_04920 [Candidatus Acidoferrum sp.]|nr:hypothetical protein [Candidatus Acidoferrum sp.]